MGRFSVSSMSSSAGSLFIKSVLTVCLLNITAVAASTKVSYSLKAAYTASNWFNSFTAQAIYDPANGFVNYLSDAQAKAAGLYKTIGNQIFVGVDNTTVLSSTSGPGRNSLRLVTNTQWNTGIFILDLAHMPDSTCGVWPAYWTLGNGTWPSTGEIDIMEGISRDTKNEMSLHTSPGCTVTVGSGGQRGTSGANGNCGNGGGGNGCNVISYSSSSYGTPFNTAGGGVYAMHWNNTEIKIWFFSRKSIPRDITSGTSPNPTNWGTPDASFAGCNFPKYFTAQNLIINTDFCGPWVNSVWKNGCAAATGYSTCKAYVAAKPADFSNAYFLINYLKIYQ